MNNSIQILQQRFENHIWEVVIPWLEDNPKAQTLVNIGYRFQERYLNRNTFVFSLLVTSLGLMVGLGIGSLLAMVL